MPHDEPADALDDLRARIAEARRAAERMAGDVPASGWATPRDATGTHDDLQALAAVVSALRDLVPPELREQVNEVLRAILMLLRAVIDWLGERLDEPPDQSPRPAVQDIPIA